MDTKYYLEQDCGCIYDGDEYEPCLKHRIQDEYELEDCPDKSPIMELSEIIAKLEVENTKLKTALELAVDRLDDIAGGIQNSVDTKLIKKLLKELDQ